MATAPVPGARERAEAAAAAENFTITVKVDDEAYTVRPNEVNAVMVGQLRRVTGFSLAELMTLATEGPDIDVIAALVFLARRQRGENVDYRKVADAITYATPVDLVDEPAPEDPDSPEA